MSPLFATIIILWYKFQWHPLVSLHIAKNTHTGVATPELLIVSVSKRFLLIPVHNPIVVLVSAHHLMTSNATWKLKSPSKEKEILQWIGRQCISKL